MLEQTFSGLKLLLFESLASCAELTHAVTTRIGGVSPAPFHSLNLGINTGDAEKNVGENYARLAAALGFDLQTVVTSHQVHGDRIALIESLPAGAKHFPRTHAHDGYDALLTGQPGITLMIRVADCVPVILYAPDRNVLALVHAGWRGTLAGIAGKAVCAMVRSGCRPDRIRAGIGPAIGPCCFSAHKDVADRFRTGFGAAGSVIAGDANGARIDLPGCNRLQLLDAGLRPGNIEMSGMCTACNLHLFFSHRGEQGKTGRFVLCAGLRA